MPKNIILLSDGTGNSSGKLFRTNVWRMYDALHLTRPDQIAYYDDGVGTSSFKPYAVLGGALGLGLKRNVKHIYAFLCRNYSPGDRIYAFGFSRGAFTIRVLIGFVHDQGLVKADTERELWKEVTTRWRAYRKRARTRIAGKIRTLIFGRRTAPSKAANPQIKFRFVGLWDTVSAYGLPIDELARAWDQYVWPLTMNDRVPSSSIEKAFHALSLDDERQTFHPVLWTEAGEPQNRMATDLSQERISQVWFAGVHSDVGGGYPDDSLSYVSLHWMMDEAAKRGLEFVPRVKAEVEAQASANGPVHDSRKGLGGYYRYNPRKIAMLCKDDYHAVTITRPKIHASVFSRVAAGDDRYPPIGLPGDYAVAQADGIITAPLLEHPNQCSARANSQERVWDIVWKRRIVYFSTLLSSAFLLLFPVIFRTPPDGACLSEYFCALSRPIAWIKPAVPAFTDRWMNAFSSNPGWFAVGVGILAFLLWRSAQLKTTIRDEMRLIWDATVTPPRSTAPTAQLPSGLIYRLLTSSLYQGFFHGLTRYVIPGLFALAIYWAAIVVLSRVELSIASTLGAGCTTTEDAKLITDTASFTFSPRDRCAATGYKLQEGARYSIWVRIDPGEPWADASIQTDLMGFSSEKMTGPMYAVLPFRRWTSQPWFKPIARIGSHGNDEYVLEPSYPYAAGAARDQLYTEIRARRDGDLFLYVNDAVYLWPWLDAYANNQGKALVIIKRTAPPAAPAQSNDSGVATGRGN